MLSSDAGPVFFLGNLSSIASLCLCSFVRSDNWSFQDFNENPDNVQRFLEENDAGNTSVPHRQNRALLFDSALFHQSDPFRFKKGE